VRSERLQRLKRLKVATLNPESLRRLSAIPDQLLLARHMDRLGRSRPSKCQSHQIYSRLILDDEHCSIISLDMHELGLECRR
jgi:hypothetical protein